MLNATDCANHANWLEPQVRLFAASKPHTPSPFVITQPRSWYSFYILQFIHFVSFPLSISCLNELISPLTKLACKSYCFTGDVKVCEYILVAIIVCVIRVAITASQCGCLIAICLNIMMSTWSHIHLSDVLIVKWVIVIRICWNWENLLQATYHHCRCLMACRWQIRTLQAFTAILANMKIQRNHEHWEIMTSY